MLTFDSIYIAGVVAVWMYVCDRAALPQEIRKKKYRSKRRIVV
jgi:hypothetical protein